MIGFVASSYFIECVQKEVMSQDRRGPFLSIRLFLNQNNTLFSFLLHPKAFVLKLIIRFLHVIIYSQLKLSLYSWLVICSGLTHIGFMQLICNLYYFFIRWMGSWWLSC